MNKRLLCVLTIITMTLIPTAIILAEDTVPSDSVLPVHDSDPTDEAQPSKSATTNSSDILSLNNEYIRIVVNGEEENSGRFALETTGGDPDRTSDDGSQLIYGWPKPWTSYTTIRINGEDYVFGGITTKRAGANGNYGEVIAPPAIEGDGIDTVYKLGPIGVLQRLEFAVSSTTGYKDSARIIYRVTNLDKTAHSVGVRIMLDTLLGANDGAPFRFNEDALLGDAEYSWDELPEFWQAFDSLSDPRVIAQGTLVGPDVTRPNRIVFSNWGSFADGLWDVDYVPNREFVRLGEFELDSAAGLYWEPQILQPGETRTYVTSYGMGGLSISPGELSLGVTSPATIALGKDGRANVPVVAYLENTGAGIGRELSITLKTPKGLTLSPDTPGTRKVGFLRPGRGTQTSWDLQVDSRLAGKTVSLRVEVTGPDIKPIAVERRLRILGPPQLKLNLSSQRNERTGYYVIGANLVNTGQSSAYTVDANLKLPEGWAGAPHESVNRFLGEIRPVSDGGKEINWQWQVKPKGIQGEPALNVELTSTNSSSINVRTADLVDFNRNPAVVLRPTSAQYTKGELLTYEVNAKEIDGFNGIRLVIQYNPAQLVFLDYSRGSLWVDDHGQTYDFSVTNNPNVGQIIIEGHLPGKTGIYSGVGEVTQLKFLALQTGQLPVSLVEAPLLYSSVSGQEISLQVEPISVSE